MHLQDRFNSCGKRTLAVVLLLTALTARDTSAQQLQLDTGFGNSGSLNFDAGNGWYAAWNDRNAHIVEISSTQWVMGGSFSQFINPNLFYLRRYVSFHEDTVGALSSTGWGVGPPLSTGGILHYSDSSIGFVGTGNPGGGAITNVHQARTFLSSGDYASCAGGFQANHSFGPIARDEVRAATRGWFVRGAQTTLAVGSTRLANGESRGLIAQFREDCTIDSGFGSGGAVLLDVNPFVIGAPLRSVRINTVMRYLNIFGEPRVAVGGGVRYGLASTDPGACFIAIYNTEGQLDGAFDFDGIRIYDPPVQGGGNIACDFNTLVQTGLGSEAGLATIADWQRVGGGTRIYEAAPVRFNANGSLFADWSNFYSVGTLTERGPSSMAIRSDQQWVFGSSLLSGQVGGTPMASTELRLIHPGTGLGSSATSVPWLFGDSSAQISKILPLANNRVLVIGTSGTGRFGHQRLHVARYSDGRFALNVSVTGSGDGAVTSATPGISCNRFGGDCEEFLDPGSQIALTATAGQGAVFAGWSGDAAACALNPNCNLTINAAIQVNAQFVPLNSLTVARGGNGMGSITSTPAGINCGAQCSASFPANAVINLMASPVAGSGFSHWTDDMAACGNNPQCAVSMQTALSGTGVFTLMADALFGDGFE